MVGTRLDCVSIELLDYFTELSKRYYVMIEYGVESTCDDTLQLINRGHDYASAEEAVRKTAGKGLRTAAHLILGLPGESREMILSHADNVSGAATDSHQTASASTGERHRDARQYAENPEMFNMMTAAEYIELVIDFLERLNPEIAVERFVSQSPEQLLIAPHWGLKNFEFVHKIEKRLKERNTWQGRLFRFQPPETSAGQALKWEPKN